MMLSERLRYLRNKRRLTLFDLHILTGLSVSYLSDIENGRTDPSLKTLCKLANAYNISLTMLFSGIDNPYPEELVP